jgi:hypothetical protein
VVTNVLGVGADFRTLFFTRNDPVVGSSNGFWQMQGDLYLNLRVAKKVNVFLKKGLRDGFEVFGLFNVLPAGGHVKVGKFVPNFGMKTDDHTAYVRSLTGWSPEFGRIERTGLELAVSPGPVTVTGGIYNAEEGLYVPGSSQKAFLGRAEGIFALAEKIYLGLGADVFTKKVSGVTNTLFGGFGSLSIGDLTVLGEADAMKEKAASGTTTTGLVMSLEADYVLTQGIDLKAGYDFYDPDVDVKTGTTSRYSLGFEFFPLGGVEVRPVYRIVKDEPDTGNRNELHLLLHIYL